MVGILLVSHGALCQQLIHSVATIAGEPEQCLAVDLRDGESPDSYRQRVEEALKRLDTGSGVLALVDMIGGTPYNTVAYLSRSAHIQFVTGMNMPMLIFLAMERKEQSQMDELADEAAEYGTKGIKVFRISK